MDISRLKTGGAPKRSPYGAVELPGICTCDHPDLDPTPRAWQQQYSPIKKCVTASAGIAAASRGAKSRAHGKVALERSAQEAGAQRTDVQFAIQELSQGDGLPTRPGDVDLTQILPAAQMGSLEAVDEFSFANAAAAVRASERRLGQTGYGLRDVQLRHRSLMRRRAAANAAGSDGSAAGAPDGAENEAAVAEAAAREAARLREEARIRRFTVSPPPRFWWLLLLWLLGGPLGAHRVPLRAWRVLVIQAACAALGAGLLVVGATTLHPGTVPPARYSFQEAYIVGGVID